MNGDTFPEQFFRGLRKESWIQTDRSGEKVVSSEAFVPDYRGGSSRAETSISWNDGEKSLTYTMENRATSQHGVVIVKTSILEVLSARGHDLKWCRSPTEENRSHGDLLFKAESEKRNKMIAAAIALEAVVVSRGS